VLVEARRSFCAVCRSPSSSQLMLLSAASHLSPESTSTHGNVVKISLVTVGKMKLRPIKYVLNRLFFLIADHAPITAPVATMAMLNISSLSWVFIAKAQPVGKIANASRLLALAPFANPLMSGGNSRFSATSSMLIIWKYCEHTG